MRPGRNWNLESLSGCGVRVIAEALTLDPHNELARTGPVEVLDEW